MIGEGEVSVSLIAWKAESSVKGYVDEGKSPLYCRLWPASMPLEKSHRFCFPGTLI